MVDHHRSLWSNGILLQTRHGVSTSGTRIGVRCVCEGGVGECGRIGRWR